jgi:methionyl-tRNA formyltransferase
MYMDEGLDTGDMILKEAVPIGEEDTVGAVHDRLAALGARLLVKTLALIRQGRAPRAPQTGEFSYAPMLKAEDELIGWDQPARDIYNRIRGMNPWPGARTTLSGKVLKIWRAAVEEGKNASVPGQVIAVGRDGLVVSAGSGLLRITELQLQGARRLNAGDFLRGNPVPEGTVLGSVDATGGDN